MFPVTPEQVTYSQHLNHSPWLGHIFTTTQYHDIVIVLLVFIMCLLLEWYFSDVVSLVLTNTFMVKENRCLCLSEIFGKTFNYFCNLVKIFHKHLHQVVSNFVYGHQAGKSNLKANVTCFGKPGNKPHGLVSHFTLSWNHQYRQFMVSGTILSSMCQV